MLTFNRKISKTFKPLYEQALQEKRDLPNFPLFSSVAENAKVYNQMMYMAGVCDYFDHEEALVAEAERAYPGANVFGGIGLEHYFCKQYSKPVIHAYDPDNRIVHMIYPIYKSENFLMVAFSDDMVRDMIEETLDNNIERLNRAYSSLNKKNTEANDPDAQLHLPFLHQVHRLNVAMRDTFEKITSMEVRDRLRYQFKHMYQDMFEKGYQTQDKNPNNWIDVVVEWTNNEVVEEAAEEKFFMDATDARKQLAEQLIKTVNIQRMEHN